MKSCCEETFKDALREVLILIDNKKITDINNLINTLLNAIEMLEKKKEKENE